MAARFFTMAFCMFNMYCSYSACNMLKIVFMLFVFYDYCMNNTYFMSNTYCVYCMNFMFVFNYMGTICPYGAIGKRDPSVFFSFSGKFAVFLPSFKPKKLSFDTTFAPVFCSNFLRASPAILPP